jgi:endonuclease/exonuclease/phosphatase family metal-dependent hydrolase
MKLITLNTWGGRAGREGLLAFFNAHKDVDIFCLQEIWAAHYKDMQGKLAGGKVLKNDEIMTHGRQEISTLLSDHSAYFRPHLLDDYGLMMLVDKKVPIVEEGETFVYRHKGYIPEGDAGNHARNIQYVTVKVKNRLVTIINFHGLWNGKGKTDTEDRIQQSNKILDFIKKCSGDVILCGDFNLLPETESLRLFEKSGLRDLIKEYKIRSTRTSFYTKPEKHADYIFVTKNIKVTDFKVLPDEVSDHLALSLDFE